MRKLVQDLEKGRMRSMDVPVPKPGPQEILVKVHRSVISPGTEGKTVRDARKGYLAKARARKEELRKVLRMARERGVRETVRMVKDRLQAPSPLGYSCCGEVVELGEEVNEIRVGDRVACGGTQAHHAEYVSVPQMLCVRVPESVPSEQAAFATVGAIALQGIRRAELGIGSNALVIGAGLIGVLTAKLLEAGGVRPILVDKERSRTVMAEKAGVPNVMERNSTDLEERIAALTGGKGVDAAIITAATSSTDPVELAGRSCREGGKVVMVGDAGTGFQRKEYYRKELELRMSRSYGPGRHDPDYEEKGMDYPIGQVRWTERRNMEAFVELLGSGILDLSGVITHRFPFEKAREAYDRILAGEEGVLGVLLEYPEKEEELLRTHQKGTKSPLEGKARIGLIGGGNFARNLLLPHLPEDLALDHVATRDPSVARYLAEKYGAGKHSSDPDAVIHDAHLDAVLIATRHDSHGELTEKALRAGKSVFVEKPLCLTEGELQRIESAWKESRGSLMVGFNRRFAPLFLEMLDRLDPDAPKSVRIQVNAAPLPASHWVHDPDRGGGRILGEACHFVDLFAAIAAKPILEVQGNALPASEHPPDSFTASLRAADESIGSLSYYSNASTALPKERVEVHQYGQSFILEDFRKLERFIPKRSRRKGKQDKGHAAELQAWAGHLVRGTEPPIPFEALVNSTRMTFALNETVRGEGVKDAGDQGEKEA